MTEKDPKNESGLIDEVFANYSELQKDLPQVNKPYLIYLKSVSLTLKEGFEATRDLARGSTSLFIDKSSSSDFFGLLPGLLGEVKKGLAILSVSKEAEGWVHLDYEFIPEFGSKEAMLVTPQEMHAFLKNADKTASYVFYIDHTDGRVKKIDVCYCERGWHFEYDNFDDMGTFGDELIVHHKKAEEVALV